MTDPATYREQLDTIFRVDHASGSIRLRLAEVTGERIGGGYLQFSLLLHGPPDPVLPQDTYVMHHDALGSLALFIVPVVGSSHERIVYEVCFSQPAPSPSTRRKTDT